MSIEKFTPDELEVIGTYPGFGKPARFNTPITPRENMLRLYQHKTPMWIPSPSEMATIKIDCDPENVARSPGNPPCRIDGYGVEWVFVDVAGGAMVKPGSPKVPDINEWEKYVTVPNPEDWDWAGMVGAIKELFPTTVTEDDARKAAEGLKGDKAAEAVKKLFVDDALNQYDQFEDRLGEEGLRTLERRVVLAVLDRKWREHLYEMDYLKDGIGLRGMGQRDPLVEYQREGYQMYNSMIEAIKEESVQLLFHIDLDSVAQTEDHEDIQQDVRDDQAVDQAEVAMGDDVEEQDEVESDETQLHEPEEPDQRDDHADEVLTAANEESIKEAYDDDEAIPESGLMGPAPMSHAEGKVPASKRPKNEELKTPWADGRTFPGTSKNAPCPCGSGRKYKMCHGQNEQ